MLGKGTAQPSQPLEMVLFTTSADRPVNSGTRHAVVSPDCVVWQLEQALILQSPAQDQYTASDPHFTASPVFIIIMMWSSRRFHVPSCLRPYMRITSVIFGCQITQILRSTLMGITILSIWSR
jgi:hypothetical protein